MSCPPMAANGGGAATHAVIMDFERQICLVIGRADYCGVNKKTLFTVMNYLLPNLGHMSPQRGSPRDRSNTTRSAYYPTS